MSDVQEILAKIVDPLQPERDSLVDELNDRLEDGQYDDATTRRVVLELVELAQSESDSDVHESILNLLSGHYLPGVTASSEIEAFVTTQMSTFSVGSLDHALGIVAESKLETREQILARYAQSDNPGIRETAEYFLTKERWVHTENPGSSS